MKDELITFETAKLAKEKGFNNGSGYGYGISRKPEIPHYGNVFKNSDSNNSVNFEAPTQSLLQRWLREVHNIFISVNRNSIGSDE